ncbi:flagellar basal body-associated FliL family protein (plasmid) [Paroceanicella profunda]|uniref:Flagellar basal body-associated FliL family protein n=1 Tax=Paroceanicella profunda TaxID=2579971 RepID=A0A5B8G0V7_9RHOB|nr:flagellar basal body-associated FliL family protein [Paroceanicella profunda]QDL94766.1 flagellar basal body-associated FliL family protein [Paroceanicella profunda]
MKKLLPVILVLLGIGGGLFAGQMLKPPAPEEEQAHLAVTEPAHGDAVDHAAPEGDPLEPTPVKVPEEGWEYNKLDKQFIIPVMSETRVRALIVMSISLETEPGLDTQIATREPKLRDAFLRVLFEHERSGGFSGVFTDPRTLSDLRISLRKVARSIVGPGVNDVLVTDILRQDM